MADRIRVTLRWIQILDNLEPFFKERGEFRFSASVSGDGKRPSISRFPKEGFYEISDHPAWNKLNLDRVLFEDEVDGALTVELMGEELDTVSANDQLDAYRRSFAGTPSGWIGHYGPGEFETDIDSNDPENMTNWRVSYDIDLA
ncbi:MAG: hypothetical protein ACREL7_16785 [Longimicrobiales bacterium]